MKKTLLSIMLFIFISGSLFSQNAWTYDMYEKFDHENFRNEKIFNQIYSSDDVDIPLMNATLFFLTNEQRVKKGVTPLRYNKICEIAAYNHSKSMVENDFFSHSDDTDSKRNSPSDRGKLAGGKNASFAENIAYNYPGGSYIQAGEKLIDQWMNSSGHKANILSKKAIEFGCGVYPKGRALYATQCFQWFSDLIDSGNASDKLPQLKSE